MGELFKAFNEHKKQLREKRNLKYEPKVVEIGAIKKAEGIYQYEDWFLYPTKGFVMNRFDTRKRMRINRFIKKLNEGTL